MRLLSGWWWKNIVIFIYVIFVIRWDFIETDGIVISYNWEYNNFNIYVNLKYLIKI